MTLPTIKPAFYWMHVETGRRASAYGASPGAPAEWRLEREGFSVRWPDGRVWTPRSVNNGRPAPTLAALRDWFDARGESYTVSAKCEESNP